MMPITLDATVRQGTFHLEVHEQFDARAVALVGPSGSGKTTLLEAMAGLRTPERGRIAVGSHVLFDSARGVSLKPRERRIGYVPQDLALFPHLSVRENILYGANRGARFPLDRVLTLLELSPLLDRRTQALSGGERQRVAIARALMSAPDLLLLDEPLAALHASLRARILEDLRRVRDELAMPLMYVSHDLAEVRVIADWVLVLDAGQLTQRGPASSVLGEIANASANVHSGSALPLTPDEARGDRV